MIGRVLTLGWHLAIWVLTASAVASPAPPSMSPASTESIAQLRALPVTRTAVSGDFEDILAARNRRIIVLVAYSRTLYFNDKGQERGLVADMARDFERYLNKKLKTGARPITVVLRPVTRDRLLASLSAGEGDIAAAGLTVTPEPNTWTCS